MRVRQARAYYKLRSAVQAFQGGDIAGARERLCGALDIDHECSDARLWLGHVCEVERDPEAALKQYEIGLLFDPQNAALAQAAQQAREAVAGRAQMPEYREVRDAQRRAVSSTIVAVLIPPAGFAAGLLWLMSARTQEWRHLGAKTMLFSMLGTVAYIAVAVFAVVVGGAH
jgi:hypothetical protein